MKHSKFLPLALGAGWLLSPESLVIAGNNAGRMGWATLPLLAFIALLYNVCTQLIQSPQLPTTKNREYFILKNMAGTIPAISISIAALTPLLILAATALLVSSGYTFNEVFLYWFPNFGFAFLLLALLTSLQFFPEKVIFRVQIAFVSIAAGGLLILALYGITAADGAVTQVLSQPGSFSVSSAATIFLLFAGITSTSENKNVISVVPVAGFLIFFCWILVSLSYVDPERLASSTIPYMSAARKIMGDPGRQIMGLIVISGTCGAITGLMLLGRRMLCAISSVKSNDSHSCKISRWFFPPFTAIVTGLLMATGLAGDELLETLLRGALILWLLYYSLLCLGSILMIKKETEKSPLAGIICTSVLFAAVFTLLINHPQRMELLVFLLSMLGISGLLATIWFFINNKQNEKTQQMEKHL
jgi:hypothetical protein